DPHRHAQGGGDATQTEQAHVGPQNRRTGRSAGLFPPRTERSASRRCCNAALRGTGSTGGGPRRARASRFSGAPRRRLKQQPIVTPIWSAQKFAAGGGRARVPPPHPLSLPVVEPAALRLSAALARRAAASRQAASRQGRLAARPPRGKAAWQRGVAAISDRLRRARAPLKGYPMRLAIAL